MQPSQRFPRARHDASLFPSIRSSDRYKLQRGMANPGPPAYLVKRTLDMVAPNPGGPLDQKGKLEENEKMRLEMQTRRQTSEVSRVVADMWHEQDQALHRYHKRKWVEILELHLLLSSPKYSHLSLAGAESAIYETFYRSVPNKYVTRARFIGIMRNLCQVKKPRQAPLVASLKSSKSSKSSKALKKGQKSQEQDDLEIIQQLEKYYHCFEQPKARSLPSANQPHEPAAQLNWRHLLQCLQYVLHSPSSSSEGIFRYIHSDIYSKIFIQIHSKIKIFRYIHERHS